jgi:hypothetical protein
MQKTLMKKLTPAPLAALASMLALCVAAPALAGPAGEVTHLSGALVAQKPDGQSRILSVKSAVNEGDVLATADNSYARVKFSDGSEAVLRPASQVKIDRFNFEEQKPQADGMVLSLLKGGFRAVTGLLGKRNPAQVRVATPSATIGIRGTTFGALYCNNDCSGAGAAPPANGLHVDVSDGMIILQNQGGSQNFSAGQFGYVPNLNAPPMVVPPSPGVQFTPPPSFLGPGGQVGGIGKTGGAACTI